MLSFMPITVERVSSTHGNGRRASPRELPRYLKIAQGQEDAQSALAHDVRRWGRLLGRCKRSWSTDHLVTRSTVPLTDLVTM